MTKSDELTRLEQLRPIFKRNPFQIWKSIQNYKGLYIDKKYDKDGKLYYYDKLRKEKIDRKGINLNYWRYATGSETPFKDYQYLTKRNQLLILQAADQDKLSKSDGRQALSDLRAGLSSKVYNEQTEKVEREFDIKRRLKISQLENTVNALKNQSTYGSGLTTSKQQKGSPLKISPKLKQQGYVPLDFPKANQQLLNKDQLSKDNKPVGKLHIGE